MKNIKKYQKWEKIVSDKKWGEREKEMKYQLGKYFIKRKKKKNLKLSLFQNLRSKNDQC